MNRMILSVPRGKTKYSISETKAKLSGAVIYVIDHTRDQFIAYGDHKEEITMDRINGRLTLEGPKFIGINQFSVGYREPHEYNYYTISLSELKEYMNGNKQNHNDFDVSDKSPQYIFRVSANVYNFVEIEILEGKKWISYKPWFSIEIGPQVYDVKKVLALAKTLRYNLLIHKNTHTNEKEYTLVATNDIALRDKGRSPLASYTLQARISQALKPITKGKK